MSKYAVTEYKGATVCVYLESDKELLAYIRENLGVHITLNKRQVVTIGCTNDYPHCAFTKEANAEAYIRKAETFEKGRKKNVPIHYHSHNVTLDGFPPFFGERS